MINQVSPRVHGRR